MPRRKSIDDIAAQAAEMRIALLRQLRDPNLPSDRRELIERRINAINSTEDKYLGNIERTKSYQSVQKSYNDALTATGRLSDAGNIASRNRYYNYKYSQRTYMGLANG